VLHDCIAGIYRALHGAEVGFLTPAELPEAGQALIVAPFLLVQSEQTGAALGAYVERGGHLLTLAKTAMLDGRGWYHDTRPGAGLADLLGVTETSIDTTDEPVALRWAGGQAHGAHHVQRFAVQDGVEVVAGYADDGSPALTRRSVGAGSAWACGTHLDLAVTRLRDGGAAALIGEVVRRSGVHPLWTSEPAVDGLPRVWVRRRVYGDRALITVTSTDSAARTALVHVRAASARDLLTGEPVDLGAGVGASPVRLDVPARGTRLVALDGYAAT